MTIVIANFCRDFRWNLESDRMSRRKSVKNGPVGAHGLNYKIFANFEVIFGIHDENYPLKKFYVSPTIFKFSPPNLAGPYKNLKELVE